VPDVNAPNPDAETALTIHRARTAYLWTFRGAGFCFVLALALAVLAGLAADGRGGLAVLCAVTAAGMIALGVFCLAEARSAEETLAKAGAPIPSESEWLPGAGAGALLSGFVSIVVAVLR
jgi:hypothetical protein